jgi:4-amino-4-deoxy-L-arabinose transferase-like glycosyltransferase
MKQSFLLIIASRDVQQRELAQHLSGAERKVEMVIDRRVRERRIRGLPSPVPVERRRSNRRSLDISPLLSAQGWASVARADAAPGRADAPRTEGKPAIVRQTRALGWIALGTIIAAAIALRGYWLFQLRAAMEGNGCEYARIAQNLLTHRSYVGLFEGPELMFPPLFPFLLALGAPIAGSVDEAARLVPFLAGVLLVPAMFTLARIAFGSRVALIAAALTAFHATLVDLSRSAFSEGIYLLLMVGGLSYGLRCLLSGKDRYAIGCGAAFGLAYLARPEALLYPLVLLAAVLAKRPSPRRFGVHALCLLAPIGVLAAPYVVYLTMHTGHVRLEGKALMNFTIGARRNAGLGPDEAAFGIGPLLTEDGPQISPNLFIATTERTVSGRELAAYWIASARRNEPVLFRLILSPMFGSVFAMGLIALGLLRTPWTEQRALCESVLLSIAAAHVVLLLGLHGVQIRYMLPLLPLWLIWTSKGIDEGARWATGTSRRLRGRRTRWLGSGVRAVLGSMILLLALWGMRWGPLQDGSPALKDLGTWLDEYQPGPKRVMTVHPEIAYYAGGTFLPLPYADGSLAVRYVHRKEPDFIVLVRGDRDFSPYLAQWWEEGIRDPAAQLISRAGSPDLAIYKWLRSGGR